MLSDSPIKRKKIATPAQRNLCIRQDKSKAAEFRLMKEISRKKILIEQVPATLRPPQLYIEEAKRRYLSIQESKSTRSILSKDTKLNTSTTRSRGSPYTQQVSPHIEKTLRLNEFIPDWLLQRPDFKDACRAMEVEEQGRIPYILDVHPFSRSEEDKKLMLTYLKSIKFFSDLPESVIVEAGNKLIKQRYSQGEYIISKGDKADCLVVIYEGSVSVVLEGVKVALKKGREVVGENALDSRMPRTADVIAEENTVVFKLLKDDYEAAILNLKRREKHQNIELLKGIAFFENWSSLKLLRISALMNYKNFPGGGVIYERNNASSMLYFIKEGIVDVMAYVPMEHCNRWPTSASEWKIHTINREYLVKIASLGPGKYFGELELKDKTKRAMKVVAKTPVSCLMLNKDHFFDNFTEIEIDLLVTMSFIKIPSLKELQEKVLSQISSKISSENALLDALRVSFINLEGRESILDPQTKKLNPWLGNYKKRRFASSHSIKQKVVFETSRNVSVGNAKLRYKVK